VTDESFLKFREILQ